MRRNPTAAFRPTFREWVVLACSLVAIGGGAWAILWAALANGHANLWVALADIVLGVLALMGLALWRWLEG